MKNLIWLLIGAAVGGSIGYYLGKKKGLDVANFQIKEMEEYYKRTDEYERKIMKDTYESTDSSTNTGRENGVLDSKHRKSLFDRRSENRNTTATNYAGMYKGGDDEDDVENGGSDAEKMIEFHEENKDHAPELISEFVIGDIPKEIDHQTVFYHVHDEILSTEEGEILDVETTIGDELYDELLLPILPENVDESLRFHILNYQLDVLFIVEVHRDAWSDCVDAPMGGEV